MSAPDSKSKNVSTRSAEQWELEFPNKPLYAHVGLFRTSKTFVPKIRSQPKDLPRSHELDWYHARRNYDGTLKKLELKRVEIEDLKKEIEDQWKDVLTKELNLKKNFISFDSFIRQNDAKKGRARAKYQIMKEKASKRTADIEKTTEEIKAITCQVEGLKKETSAYKKHEDFLNKVAAAGKFETVEDLINEYFTLKESGENIIKRSEKLSNNFLDDYRIHVSNQHKFKLTSLDLSYRLSELKKKFQHAKQQSFDAENILKEVITRYHEFVQDLTWSRMALENLFIEGIHRKPTNSKSEAGNLKKLKETLKILEKLNEKLTVPHDHRKASSSLMVEVSKQSTRKLRKKRREENTKQQAIDKPKINEELTGIKTKLPLIVKPVATSSEMPIKSKWTVAAIARKIKKTSMTTDILAAIAKSISVSNTSLVVEMKITPELFDVGNESMSSKEMKMNNYVEKKFNEIMVKDKKSIATATTK